MRCCFLLASVLQPLAMIYRETWISMNKNFSLKDELSTNKALTLRNPHL